MKQPQCQVFLDERKALKMAYTQERVYTKQLAENIGRSRNVARRVLDGLVAKELMIVVGEKTNDPNRHYRLNTI